MYSMKSLLIVMVIVAGASGRYQGNFNNCPQIYCPFDHLIPNNCRKANYIPGLDGSSCRGCDGRKTNCGLSSTPPPPTGNFNNCPQIYCPFDHLIPNNCRKANYIPGLDGSSCRVCDGMKTNCGLSSTPPPPTVDPCPQIQCPNDRYIRRGCRLPTYVTGSDNVTRCRVCDRNKCA